MGGILFGLFVIVPLIEIACFVVIGQTVGLWWTLGGVLLMAMVGSLILRAQGRQLIGQFRATVGRGQLPARTIFDGVMVVLAGILLLTPGYFSDLIGILLLVPPVRTLIYSYLRTRVSVVATSTTSGFSQTRVEHDTIDLDSDEWRNR